MNRLALSLLSFTLIGAPAAAEPTRVMVRAQSADAKFIGTSMGGVRVVLRDARSKKVLAQGLIAGATGDTNRLVIEPRRRGDAGSDAQSAGFEAVLDVAEPTLVQVEGFGPVAKPGAAITVTSSLWILPGRHVAGDGLILTFPGLVVEPDVLPGSGGLAVSAKVTLMCGCPLEPGGTWDAANYTVTARMMKGRAEVARSTLAFAGKPSQFSGSFPIVPKGEYTLQVTAADRKTINTGVAEKVVRIP
ncbi:MAG TPA: hypothetical protein VF637_03720 [Sphingomicrobium sp.]